MPAAAKGSSGRPLRPAPAAWIDAEHGLAFTVTAMPRIRDALVLRPVALGRTGRGRSGSHAFGTR